MAPHWTVFERRDEPGSGPALAIGRAHTPVIRAEQLGRMAQVEIGGSGRPRRDGGRADRRVRADVHFVQVKCPLLTAQRIAEAEARGQTVSTRDTLKSMGLSRAASSLGVAIALGEVAPAAVGGRCHRHGHEPVVGPRQRLGRDRVDES